MQSIIVCLYVCLLAHISKNHVFKLWNLVYMLTVALARSSDDIAVCYDNYVYVTQPNA